MATNEDLLVAINELRQDFRDHVMDFKDHVVKEEPILESARLLFEVHGDPAQVRARVSFINAWMERERDWADLRKAVIKHSTLIVLTAVLYFVVRAIWGDVVELIRTGQILVK